jgi:hypothetical protein
LRVKTFGFESSGRWSGSQDGRSIIMSGLSAKRVGAVSP